MGINLDEIIAIDVHTHAEVSCCRTLRLSLLSPHFSPLKKIPGRLFVARAFAVKIPNLSTTEICIQILCWLRLFDIRVGLYLDSIFTNAGSYYTNNQ